MAASAQTRYYHSSSPGVASGDVTGLTVRYQLADQDTQNATFPLNQPASGVNLSWRKSSKINFVTTPATAIQNLRWFMSQAPSTGISLFARVQSAGTYVQASSADAAGIAGFTDTTPNQATNNATNYTAVSPLSVNAGTVLSNPNTGEGSQVFVETQFGVASSYALGPGVIPTPSQVTYRYAES